MCCRSKITAFLSKTVEFFTQESEAGFFHQGYLPTAAPDVVQVYVYGDQGLFVTGSLRNDAPPGVDDVGVARENETALFPHPISDYNVTLKHAGIKAGDVPPVFLRVQQLRVRVGTAVGGNYEHLGPVLNRDEGEERLPGAA